MGVFTPIPKIDGKNATGVLADDGDETVRIEKVGESHLVQSEFVIRGVSSPQREVSEETARGMRQSFLLGFLSRR